MHFNSIFSCVDPCLWGFLHVCTWGLAWLLAMELEMKPEVDKEVLRTGEGNRTPETPQLRGDRGGEGAGLKQTD